MVALSMWLGKKAEARCNYIFRSIICIYICVCVRVYIYIYVCVCIYIYKGQSNAHLYRQTYIRSGCENLQGLTARDLHMQLLA